MLKRLFKGGYSTLFSFIATFMVLSTLIRTFLLLISIPKADFSFTGILKIYFLGAIYDFGLALMFSALYSLYLLLFPARFTNSMLNRAITLAGLFLTLLIVYFSFFAELTFWQEFESRFNFIAVDYLIYTYEVVHNINESYPLPLLIGGVFLMVLLTMWLFASKHIFRQTFSNPAPFSRKLLLSGSLIALSILYPLLLSNTSAESGNNRYENELSKAGIWSFFAAFRNNELNYNDFYSRLPDRQAYALIRKSLQEPNSKYLDNGNSITRSISNSGPLRTPNVIMITVESLSAEFMAHFGNTQGLTPVLDSLADENVWFSQLYATGTRTVRGMEALSLCIPPTPGNSIVRRQDNHKLSTVGHIFQNAGYHNTFFYGGDGYFDNMNEYFGNNGFDITDRGRNLKINDSYTTKRTLIPDSEVQFKNAWGICDEDLFRAVIRNADQQAKNKQSFYDFVMTTSNHRPFTFPDGKIAMPAGTREAAVRYTDYAIGKFLEEARQKPWYKNTVIMIVADHCAGSAGKNEIDISKYRIPCLMLNLPGRPRMEISKVCSQIDLYPTLFSLLGWKYESKLYGKNVLDPAYQSRVLLGTYQKLAYLKKDSLVILDPGRQVESYLYNAETNEQQADPLNRQVIDQARAQYQTAYDLYKNGSLHQ